MIKRYVAIPKDVPSDVYLQYYNEEGVAMYRYLGWNEEEEEPCAGKIEDDYGDSREEPTLEDEIERDKENGMTIITDPEEIDKILVLWELTHDKT